MSPQPNKTSHERRVFQSVVVEQYMEIKGTHGTSSCSGFYKGLAREGGRTGLNPRVVTVSPSDFIADVELAGREALNFDPKLQAAFHVAFVRGYGASFITPENLERIEQAVGRMLIAKRIYPTETYFKAKDCR